MIRNQRVSYGPQRAFRKIVSSWSKMLVFILFVLVFVSSCSGPGGANTELSGTIRIDGSTALQPLVTQAAAAFQKEHPLVHITVEGGGSFTGLNDVSSKKVHIGDSDIYASFAAYPNPDMTDHIVCVTPFSLITNLGVSVPSLTLAQIVAIFSSNQ